jgi:hypothetical protein
MLRKVAGRKPEKRLEKRKRNVKRRRRLSGGGRMPRKRDKC